MASNYGRDYGRGGQGMGGYGASRGYGSDYSDGGYGTGRDYGYDPGMGSTYEGRYGTGGMYGGANQGYGYGRGEGGYDNRGYGYSNGGFGSYGNSGAGRGDYGGYGDSGYGYGNSNRGSGYGSEYWGAGLGNRGQGYSQNRDQGQDYGQNRSNMRASELMTRDPETLTADATLVDAAKKMRDMDIGIIPVVESNTNKRLKGLITDRDIAVRAVAEGKDVKSTKVSDCMTTDVESCNQNDSVRDVLDVMQREQVRRVPITDREGRLVGIIAQADVAADFGGDNGARDRQVADTLEEISEPARPARQRGARGRSGASEGAQQQ